MGVLDKFLDIMRLSDDDDYDDDDFFGEEDDFEEPKKSFFKKGRKYDLDDEDDDEFFEEKSSKSSSFSSNNNNNKITQMRQPVRKGATMEVCVIKPSTVDEAREITETLLSGRTVILNLEGLDLEVAQRIIDFTSGATFAINGNLQKISNYIFLVTPSNIDISGDLQDLLNSSFDVPSIKTKY